MTRLICLRDDDTNYYTKYEELADGYGEFWGKLPVTLATVPFSHGSQFKIMKVALSPETKWHNLRDWELNATADELTEYHKLHPIGENKELVEKFKPLIKAKKIEIAQHGISHRCNEKGAEMYYDNVGLIHIRDGKEYLSKVFETDINVFVPPWNTVDPRCAKYINKIGLEILCSGSISFRSLKERLINFIGYPKDFFTRLKRKILKEYPVIYSRCGVCFTTAPTFNMGFSVDDMFKRITELLKKNNAVAITTHYMALNDLEYRKKYQEFLYKLCKIDDVEFVTATEYIKRLKGNII